jgi:hypothetical protein
MLRFLAIIFFLLELDLTPSLDFFSAPLSVTILSSLQTIFSGFKNSSMLFPEIASSACCDIIPAINLGLELAIFIN